MSEWCQIYGLFPTRAVLITRVEKGTYEDETDDFDDIWSDVVALAEQQTSSSFNRSMLGHFILNPRLRTWAIKMVAWDGHEDTVVLCTRENDDGTPMEPDRTYKTPMSSDLLDDDGWLRRLKVRVPNKKPSFKPGRDVTFVVLISHADVPDTPEVRVLFRFVCLPEAPPDRRQHTQNDPAYWQGPVRLE